MAELQKARRQGMPSGRTSMLEPPTIDPLAIHPASSEKRHHQPCRPFHERKLGDQTKDDIDKEPREERSCGRSQTLLYNHRRPHQAMNNQFPMAAWRAGTDRIEAAKTVDMPLRLDNANALPTYPQQTQKQQQEAA